MKPITVAIAGCGSRGLDTYATYRERFENKMVIVAAADPRPEKLAQMKKAHGLTDAQCFSSAEEMLAAGRLADVLFICTPDHLHYAHAMAALQLDYHLLLEKPIAPDAQECMDIERLAKARSRRVIVCHVLRYTVFYQKIKELLDTGAVGELVSIQAAEQVGYWHHAHSFVRGNWGNAVASAPMILAKCCHDMDMLLWISGKQCRRVSSFGSLRHFTKDFAPAGAPMRCTDGCPAGDECPYNAERYYMGKLRNGEFGWPLNILTTEMSEESVMRALREGPYGRCVYHCGNDVVDHQVVNLELEDGLTVSFSMCGFTDKCKRTITLMGTHGQICGDMETNEICVMRFGKPEEVIDVTKLTDDFSGHAGGDARMLEELLDLLAEEGKESAALSSVERSVESHLVALAAEYSRTHGGEVVDMQAMYGALQKA